MNDPRVDFEGHRPETARQLFLMIHDRMEDWVHSVQEQGILDDRHDRTAEPGWDRGVAEMYLFIEGIMTGNNTETPYEDQVSVTLDRVGENLYGDPEIMADGTVSGSGEVNPADALWTSPKVFSTRATIEEDGRPDADSSRKLQEFASEWVGSDVAIRVEVRHPSEWEKFDQLPENEKPYHL
jgi:hypothetical protein